MRLEQALSGVEAPVERARDEQRRLVELVGRAEQVVLLERAPDEIAPGGHLLRRRPPLAPLSQLAVVVGGEAGGEGGERRQQPLRLQVGHARADWAKLEPKRFGLRACRSTLVQRKYEM